MRLSALLIGMIWAAASANATPIDYRVAVAATGAGAVLTVEMTFDGDADGSTDIALPTNWAGSGALWRHLSGFSARGGALLGPAKEGALTIRHRAGARVRLRYRIEDGQAGLPEARSFEKARPVVESDWFYVHGEGAIAMPAGREAAPARFRWGKRPRGWALVSDLDVAPQDHLTANDVATGILFGGADLRLTRRAVAGQPILLAARGRWDFADSDLADRLARLIATENDMLGAPARPYVVTLAPLAGSQTAMSYGGSGRVAGFALTATDNVPLGDFTRLLAHEYAHRWFGPYWVPQTQGAEDYWFTEGFADWFAARAMVRAGLWTPPQWREAINGLLLRYASSTARDLSDAQVTGRFWADPDAMQVQYDRGNIAANLLDARLHAEWTSLLAVLAQMAPSATGALQSGTDRFSALAGRARVAAARQGAATLPLATGSFAPCGALESASQPDYDRGFTVTAENRVEMVRPDGPAFAAGVRPGFRYMKRISFVPGDASHPYVADFLDGDRPMRLSWLPAGMRPIRFQRLIGPEIESAGCVEALR